MNNEDKMPTLPESIKELTEEILKAYKERKIVSAKYGSCGSVIKKITIEVEIC